MLTFSEFTRARHELWLERTYGARASDLAEPLRGYHYTNLWRELDRGTVFLFNDIQRPRLDDPVELVRHTIFYRIFNVRATYEAITDTFDDGLDRVAGGDLRTFLAARPRNFTNAYIRCCDLGLVCDQLADLDAHIDTIRTHLDSGDARQARKAISGIYSFGSFTGDQLMMDLCWTGGPWDVEFAPSFGPGAKRGFAACGEVTVEELLGDGSRALNPTTRPLVNGEPLPYDLRTLEHTLCEYSKYIKIENKGEKQVKMRNYKASDRPLDPLPFPWQHPSQLTAPQSYNSQAYDRHDERTHASRL